MDKAFLLKQKHAKKARKPTSRQIVTLSDSLYSRVKPEGPKINFEISED